MEVTDEAGDEKLGTGFHGCTLGDVDSVVECCGQLLAEDELNDTTPLSARQRSTPVPPWAGGRPEDCVVYVTVVVVVIICVVVDVTQQTSDVTVVVVVVVVVVVAVTVVGVVCVCVTVFVT